ncbi:hypothetical protein M0813_18619 [Anaeramoeba flamelloides]|uniref:Uncharacterized protein n=1 Tax=Anaeramoeba flamelloides TaxID=1746091 RepID=A0ABQ8YRN3_9EUKA|nr:hypothetical protein M0813_18619 [Anaeramoeba flamelloides]
MNLFEAYPFLTLPPPGLKIELEKELEKVLTQTFTQQKNDPFLPPPTHSNKFFDKTLFLKNSKINQEKENMKEEAKINKEKKLMMYERVKKYMTRNNISSRECAILSNIPDIINNRNGVVCIPVIEQVELYLTGKYLNHNYDQLFRRWLIHKRDSDWKESKKSLFQGKGYTRHTVNYHFEDYTSEEIRSMIKNVIEKSKKTEFKLSQSKIAAIVNLDEFWFRNVKYSMQKYLSGKSSNKDHSLDRKFFDWLSLRGKLLPPLTERYTLLDSNEKGSEEFKEQEQEQEQEKKQKQLQSQIIGKNGKKRKKGKNRKNSKIKNNNKKHKFGHRQHNHSKHKQKNHKILNKNDDLDDLVLNLRSCQRKKKKKKKKHKLQKSLKKKSKKKFTKTHSKNFVDQNFLTNLSTKEMPTLKTREIDYDSIYIKQRKRKPKKLKKKKLKKNQKSLNDKHQENCKVVFCD